MSQHHTLYQKNLEALKQKDPQLALKLAQLKPDNRYFLARAGDGSPIVGIKLDNGQNVALAHSQTPGIEAEDWVKSLGEPFLKSAHAMLLGFGSAYHPLYLFQLSDSDTALWFVEPELNMFYYALHIIDYTNLINSSRTHFAIGYDAIEVRRLVSDGPTNNRFAAQGLQLAFHGVAKQLYGQFIKALQQQINEALQMKHLKFKTNEKQGKITWHNCLNNLSAVFQGTPVLRLLNQAAGLPALVIAPGPSLQDDLPLIKEIQDRVLLITVDTAHRILLKHNIHSDLVLALDFTELNAKHFESLDNDPAHLVTFPGVHPSIIEKYIGRTYFYDHSGSTNYDSGSTLLFRTLKSLGPLGQLISYGSTAHATYHLARFMGCSPIILIGNDLAFPNNRRYTSGTIQEEMKLTDQATEQIEVPANDGNTVMTRGIYKTYLFDFEPLLKQTAGNVFNTAVRGAIINHAPYKSLEQIVALLPKHTIDKSFIAKSAQPILQKQKTDCIQELKRIADLCEETKTLIRPIAKQIRYLDPNDLNFKLNMINSLKAFMSINQSHQGFAILDLASSLCSRSIVSMLGQYGDVGLLGGDSPKKNQIARDRCNELFKDLDLALDFIIQELRHTANHLSSKAVLDDN